MANINSTRYTILFATTVCVVCAALVATAAVSLKPAQVANARLYMEKNVLVAAGLAEHGQAMTVPEVQAVFDRAIQARLVDLAMRRGESGPLPALGFFFKDPAGSDEHALAPQHDLLVRWATEGVDAAR